MRSLVLGLATVQFAQAVPVSLQHFKRETTKDTASSTNRTIDYIAGGRLSGLVVASLLSEGSDVSDLVIEAGNERHEDPLINCAFQSTPCPAVRGRHSISGLKNC